MAKRSSCPLGKPRVAGSILDRDIYFHFAFPLVSRSLQLGRALTNEINQEHSSVVIVVLDPKVA